MKLNDELEDFTFQVYELSEKVFCIGKWGECVLRVGML